MKHRLTHIGIALILLAMTACANNPLASSRVRLALTGHKSAIHAIAFSPDGKRLATASEDRTSEVWDATTGHELFALTGHTGPGMGIAFSPDGTRLATASPDNTAKVSDAPTCQNLPTLPGHTAL